MPEKHKKMFNIGSWMWCAPHPELVGAELIDVGPLARHRLVPEAELQQELIPAWHQHLAALFPVSREILPGHTRLSMLFFQLTAPRYRSRIRACECLPGFVSACSSPLLELGIHPCNATDGLGIQRNAKKLEIKRCKVTHSTNIKDRGTMRGNFDLSVFFNKSATREARLFLCLQTR